LVLRHRIPAGSGAITVRLGKESSVKPERVDELGVDFYDRVYHPDALSETQRQHTDRWHDLEAKT
jgi:hypothetical protein